MTVLMPFDQQDSLGLGLVKTIEGDYIEREDICQYGIYRDDSCVRFSMMQPRLVEGYLTFEEGDYVHIDKLDEIKRCDCLVATAVYGNPGAFEVQVLRDFRDNKLRQNPVGMMFVDFYYSGAGRRAANLVEKVPFTILVIRKGLDHLVERYSSHKE